MNYLFGTFRRIRTNPGKILRISCISLAVGSLAACSSQPLNGQSSSSARWEQVISGHESFQGAATPKPSSDELVERTEEVSTRPELLASSRYSQTNELVQNQSTKERKTKLKTDKIDIRFEAAESKRYGSKHDRDIAAEGAEKHSHAQTKERNKKAPTSTLSSGKVASTKAATPRQDDIAKQDEVEKAPFDPQSLIDKINALNAGQPTAAGIKPPIQVDSNESQMSESLIRDPRPLDTKVQTEPDETTLVDTWLVSDKRQKVGAPKSYVNRASKLAWNVHSASSSTGCALSSPTIQLETGGYTSQLWFGVEDGQLLVHSTMNLDSNLPGVGVQMDGGPLLSFGDSELTNNVLWISDIESIVQKRDSLRVYLGGDELGKNVQEAYISLEGLKREYPKYQTCQSLQVSQARL